MRALLALGLCAFLGGVCAGPAAAARAPDPEAVVSLIARCPRKKGGIEIVPLVGVRCDALGRIDLPGGQVVPARMSWGRVAPLRLGGTLRLGDGDGTLVAAVTGSYFQLDIGGFVGVGRWRAVGGDRGPLQGRIRWIGGPDPNLTGPILRINLTLRLTNLVAV